MLQNFIQNSEKSNDRDFWLKKIPLSSIQEATIKSTIINAIFCCCCFVSLIILKISWFNNIPKTKKKLIALVLCSNVC